MGNGQDRNDIKPGMTVDVETKNDQASGIMTRGVVSEILTNSNFHPHGIKVRLEDGQIGRVKTIIK